MKTIFLYRTLWLAPFIVFTLFACQSSSLTKEEPDPELYSSMKGWILHANESGGIWKFQLFVGANMHPGGNEYPDFKVGDFSHIKKDLKRLKPGSQIIAYVPVEGETWFATGKLPETIEIELSEYCKNLGLDYQSME